jgi:hypothetical protein
VPCQTARLYKTTNQGVEMFREMIDFLIDCFFPNESFVQEQGTAEQKIDCNLGRFYFFK